MTLIAFLTGIQNNYRSTQQFKQHNFLIDKGPWMPQIYKKCILTIQKQFILASHHGETIAFYISYFHFHRYICLQINTNVY